MTPEQFPAALIDADDRAAASALAAMTGCAQHDALVVLGSGLAAAVDELAGERGVLASGRLSDLPGVLTPVADGHEDRWCSIEVGAERVLVALGRTHLYEGHDIGPARRRVTALVRAAAAAGATRAVLTNANGCLREWRLGDVAVVVDHANLTGSSPFDGTVFLDPREVWDPDMATAAAEVADRTGTYAQLRGPEYQSVAESRMLAAAGIEIVGMSTVHEALMARALGMRVAGLSVVSDLSFSTEPVDAETVLAAAEGARGRLVAGVRAALSA